MDNTTEYTKARVKLTELQTELNKIIDEISASGDLKKVQSLVDGLFDMVDACKSDADLERCDTCGELKPVEEVNFAQWIYENHCKDCNPDLHRANEEYSWAESRRDF